MEKKKNKVLILNAARGGVIDEQGLKEAIDNLLSCLIK